MLLITDLMWSYPLDNIEVSDLFNRNPHLTISIKAPLSWWFSLMYMTEVTVSLVSVFNSPDINDFRLGDMVTGALYITYQELVGMVQDYELGRYEVVRCRREWKDFIETVLDIKGIYYYSKEVN